MKITPNEELTSHTLQLILQRQDIQPAILQIGMQLIENEIVMWTDEAERRKELKAVRKQFRMDNMPEDRLARTVASIILMQRAGITDHDTWALLGAIITTDTREFTPDDVMNTEYVKQVGFPSAKQGQYELTQVTHQAYELFPYDQSGTTFAHISTPKIGWFNETVREPAIRQNNETWMSISPSEIITMASHIRNAHGKVLTIGCGLGYFAFEAARKPDVESVTIVELEPDVIKLFTTHILPKFDPEIRAKIEIVQAEGVQYLANLEDGRFDYCLVDIWKNNQDIETYLRCKTRGREFKNTTVEYWIEEALCQHIAELATTDYIAQFSEKTAPGSVKTSMPEYMLPNLIFTRRITRKLEIASKDDIENKLTSKYIRQLLDESPELQESINRAFGKK